MKFHKARWLRIVVVAIVACLYFVNFLEFGALNYFVPKLLKKSKQEWESQDIENNKNNSVVNGGEQIKNTYGPIQQSPTAPAEYPRTAPDNTDFTDTNIENTPLEQPIQFQDENYNLFRAGSELCEQEEQSKYCSIGTARPYIGSMDEWDNVAKVLEARSHYNEIILLMCDKNHLEMPLNTIMTLRERGYEHYTLLMLSEQECQYAATIIPNVGCIWSDFLADNHPDRYWHDIRRLWMIRWLVILRFIQKGSNILMIDSDNGVLHDIYKFIKHDTFEKTNILAPYEPNLPGINCGAIYVQNAKPDGPIAWMAAEVAERTLRWLDDIDWLIDKHPEWEGDEFWIDGKVLFEQDIFNDAACSAVFGRPLYQNSFSPHKLKQRTEWEDHQKMYEQLCGLWHQVNVSVPQDWTSVAHKRRWHELLHLDLQLPSADGKWPNMYGGYPYPSRTRGKFAQMAQDWVRSVPSPLWPRPEEDDPNNIREDRIERLGRAPAWLFARWPESGVSGWWDPDLYPPVGAVLAHAIVMQGNDGLGKLAPFKLYGWWHWEATNIIRGSQIFGSSTPARPLPRVLAFAPEVNMYSPSKALMFYLAHHLLRAAALSNRVVVWPLVHCSTPWIGVQMYWYGDGRTEPSPLHDFTVVPFGGIKDMRCVSFLLMSKGCHEVGMPWYDFEHLLTLLPSSAAKRTPSNTLLFPHLENHNHTVPKFKAGFQRGFRRGSYRQEFPAPLRLNGTVLIDRLARMDDQPVVWVGNTIAVEEYPEQFKDDFVKKLHKCSKPELRWNEHVLDGWWDNKDFEDLDQGVGGAGLAFAGVVDKNEEKLDRRARNKGAIKNKLGRGRNQQDRGGGKGQEDKQQRQEGNRNGGQRDKRNGTET